MSGKNGNVNVILTINHFKRVNYYTFLDNGNSSLV